MSIKFRYNSTTYTLWDSTSRVTTPSLCHRKGGTTYHTPLLTSRSQTIGDYVYSASKPTVCVKKDSTIYYAAKSRTVAYDIPAGIYKPSNFKTLIELFISSNGSRTCKYTFSVKVFDVSEGVYPSGHSITVPANSVIKRVTQYSNKRQGVSFNGGDMSNLHWNKSTVSGGYIYYNTYNRDPFTEWARSNIYVSGIKFN